MNTEHTDTTAQPLSTDQAKASEGAPPSTAKPAKAPRAPAKPRGGAKKGNGKGKDKDADKVKLDPWTHPTFTHRRALMVGDAVMEEAAADTVMANGPTTLIKGLPITEHLRKNRGVKSFGDATQSNKDKDEPYNLMEGNIVQTRPQTPGVRVAFEMALLPADFAPAQGGNVAYMTAVPVLKALFAQHDPLHPFGSPADNVALRLALATVNASWLWRNRTLASTIKIRVAWRVFEKDGSCQAHELLVDNVRHWPFDPARILPGGSLADPHGWVATVAPLAKDMGRTLRDETLVLRCFVEAWLDVPASTRVFPSQLRTGEKDSRSYFKLPAADGHLGLTAEKISNKLRTLDAWHGDERFKDTSIPIEIFGSSLEYGLNVREDRPDVPARSLLGLWKKLVKETHTTEQAVQDTLAELTSDEQHFIVAWFLRGGTGTYNTKKAKADEAAKPDGADAKATTETEPGVSAEPQA